MSDSEKYPTMTANKVSYVDIERASNGYIVSWGEKGSSNKSSMDHMGYTSKKKIFSIEEKEEAFENFLMYKKKAVECKHENKDIY